ncbi:MAG: maleylpyruvate isomerase family mycothiol-dependent enzyme [Ilumatobacteraceae bacterium]
MVIDFLAAIRKESARFSQLARSVPHDVPVPHLPGWTVHDLVAHLAGDYRWAQQIITSRVRPSAGLRAVDFIGEALCDEWDTVAAELLELLTFCDPGSACPNFAQGDDGMVAWWVRHQAHETTLHRWDLEAAAGRHTPIVAAMALDGIDELFPVYAERYSPFALTAPVTLGCPGHGRAWTVAPVGDGTFVRATRTDELTSTDVMAAPDVLQLALWNRILLGDPRVRITANEVQVRALFDGPLTA